MKLVGPGKQYTLVCTQLSLSGVKLQDDDVETLMEWLTSREISVQNLQLFKNEITDVGAKHIANYLRFQQDEDCTAAPCL